MRFLLLLLICLLFSGCASWELSRHKPPPNVTLAPAKMIVVGRITSVQLAGNFVVIDFAGGAVPPKGRELSVYRDERKVGRVQMTEPSYPPFGAANILEGLLEVGNTVR